MFVFFEFLGKAVRLKVCRFFRFAFFVMIFITMLHRSILYNSVTFVSVVFFAFMARFLFEWIVYTFLRLKRVKATLNCVVGHRAGCQPHPTHSRAGGGSKPSLEIFIFIFFIFFA